MSYITPALLTLLALSYLVSSSFCLLDFSVFYPKLGCSRVTLSILLELFFKSLSGVLVAPFSAG